MPRKFMELAYYDLGNVHEETCDSFIPLSVNDLEMGLVYCRPQ